MAANFEDLLNGQAKKSESKHELLKTFIAIASLLVATIVALASKDMPLWGLALLAIVVVFLLAAIAWTPAVWLCGKLGAWRARNRAARIFYPDVEQMMRRLERQLSDSYTESPIHELRNYSGVRDKNGVTVIEPLSDFNRINEWVRLFAPKAAHRHRSAFADVARAMSLAATQYWWLCYGIQNRLQGMIAQGSLAADDSKRLVNAWNHGRESANRFFADWADLSEKINAQMPEHIGSADRSPLKAIA